MANEDTYRNLPKEQKLNAVRREMTPFFLYAALPVIFTIIVAFVFGPDL